MNPMNFWSMPKKDMLCLSSNVGVKHLISNDRLFFENAAIRRAITLIASSIAWLKVSVLKDGKVCDNINRLVNNPSFGVSWSDFIEGFVTNYLIYGNAYIWLTNEFQNWQMFNLSNNVKIIAGDNGAPKAYEIFSNGNKTVVPNNSSFPCVGHFKSFNPNDHWYGSSILDSLRLVASLAQGIESSNLAILQNGGRPSGIVTMKNNSQPLTNDQKEIIRESLVGQHQGPDNAGKIVFITGDCEWVPMNISAKDMDYSDAARRALRAIAGGFGVPAVLIGDTSLEGESSRSNFNALFEVFNRVTIFPLAKKISEFFTLFFSRIESGIEVKLISNDEFKEVKHDEDENKNF